MLNFISKVRCSCNMEPATFCWIVARSKRMRFARAVADNPIGDLPVTALWTAEVQRTIAEQIPHSQFLQSLEAKFKAAEGQRVAKHERSSLHVSASLWQQASCDLHGQVLGYAILQPEFLGHSFRLLDDQCQQMRDFWMFTVYHDFPVIFSKILEAALGDEPILVHEAGEGRMGRHNRNWFFRISPGSVATLNSKFPEVAGVSTDLALCLPAPHALLILLKRWPRCGLPQVLQGRRSGAWLAGRSLLQAIQAEAEQGNDRQIVQNPDWVLDPANILTLARNFQKLVQPVWAGGDEILQETRQQLAVLQKLRDNMLLDSARLSRMMYDMTHVLECVMLAADLKSADRLPEVLLRCLRLAVSDPAARSFYERMLEESRPAPSKRTLLRHRLTVHVGYLRVRALLLDRLFDATRQAPGVVRWSTMDASPHKGYEFVLSGHCTMALQDLPAAARHAFVMLSSDASAEARAGSVEFLNRRLQLVPAAPAAVGSARQALPYKIKAAAHATRLESNSWSQVAVLLNSTFSWTGDLGTESHICSWRGSLADLFGDWVVAELTEEEPGFQFQAIGVADGDEEGQANMFDVVPLEAAPNSRDVRDAGVRVDFTPQVFVAGMLHINHNMTRNLETALNHWGTFVVQLTHVCKLLAQPWSCRRFLTTCLDTPPWSARKPEFEAFHSVVYSGRWGTTMAALQNLLPLLDILRKVWNIDKFGRAVAGDREQQQQEQQQGGGGGRRFRGHVC